MDAHAGDENSPVEPRSIIFGLSAAVTVAITFLRQAFAGFWFHPIGFILAPTRLAQNVWGSLLVAWAIRFAVLKLGGASTVREKLRPAAFGIVAAAITAFILFALSLLGSMETGAFVRWMMGSVTGQTLGGAVLLGAALVVLGGPVLMLHRGFDLVAQGREEASALGLSTRPFLLFAFAAASALAAATVAATGIIGFVGLSMFILGSFHSAFSSDAALDVGSEEIVVPKRLRHLVSKSIVLGAFVHLSWQWINGESVHLDLTERLLPISGLMFCVMGSKGKIRELDKKTCFAASVTMMVHLLAAGGFEMPVVMLLLLTTSALGHVGEAISIRRAESGFISRYWMCPGISFSALTAVTVLRFGLMDVSGVDRYLLLGDDLLHRQGNLREAVVAYRQAAEADLLAVTPRQRIAELTAYVLREESRQLHRITSAAENSYAVADSVAEQQAKAGKSFEKSLEACNFWISVDDRNSFSRGLKAECLSLGSQLTGEDRLLNEAIDLQREVVEMYPSSVNAWMQLVRFCLQRERSGVLRAETDEVLAMATDRVQQLDDINHKWGHQDRYLSDDDRTLLQDAMKTQPEASR